MQYRLLRNNKESGPYTKAQLEEMGLKPYDLLWLEGRGGAWLYASEIEDLKSIAPAIEEQPYDRFYKGKEKQSAIDTNSKQNASYTTGRSAAASSTATLKPPKPRFRISGDKVVMIDNTALQEPKPLDDALSSFTNKQPQQTALVAAKPVAKQEIGAHIQSVGLAWENMYSDWKGEEQAVAEKAAPAKVQTMEEVKQRYEESKLKLFDEKQNKTASATKQNVMAAVAIVVLAIGGYAGYKLNNGSDSKRTTQTTPVVEKAEIIQDGSLQQIDGSESSVNTSAQPTSGNAGETPSTEINNSISADNSTASTAVPLPVENKSNTPDSKKEPSTQETASVVKKDQKDNQQEQTTATNKENATPDNNSTSDVKNEKADNTEAVVKKENANGTLQNPTATVPNVIKQPEAAAKKISDYITVSRLGSNDNNGSVQNVLLSVKNVTDFPIDLAVIDIQYFGANGRFQKGETMYVKNIASGSNINVRIPDGKTARSINYKISLVSSEQKTLYLVGE
jgi:hypothetical protein